MGADPPYALSRPPIPDMRYEFTSRLPRAAVALLLLGCAQTAQRPYVAPTHETVFSTTEERGGIPPAHLFFVENRSTVAVRVFSINLTNCENVKQSCGQHSMNLRVGPGERQLAARVEASDPERAFGYNFGFSWHADSAGINALNALAANGDEQARTRLAAIQRSDSLQRDPRGPHFNELSRSDFAALSGRARSLRVSPDSLVLTPGTRADLQQVHLLLLDSMGVVLGQTQWVRYQVPGGAAVGFLAPSTLVARTPGRAIVRFRLSDEAQQILTQLPADDVDYPVIVAFPVDPHAPVFEGVTVDADSRKPLGCARVALEDSLQNTVATGRTDARGLFVLHAPRPGTYAVRVEAFGWAPVTGPLESAQPDESKQHVYPVRFTDQLLMSPVFASEDVQPAYPTGVTADATRAASAGPLKRNRTTKAVIWSAQLRGSASMPILHIVGNAPPGTWWLQFTVDSAGHVDPASIVSPRGMDNIAASSVDIILPHVRFSPAREGRQPICELKRMQVNFSPR